MGQEDWIDTSLYENITIAGKTEMILDIKLYWLDEHSDTLHADLGVDLDTTWTEIGPVSIHDINPGWDDEKATRFWLQFSHSTSVSPTDVRIGWIRLTE